MKEYQEVRSPYLSAACKPGTAIAAHVVLFCDCGSQVDIVRYLHSGRCRIFISGISGSVDMPDDEMVIYSSLRRLPHSLVGLLGLACAGVFQGCFRCL